MFWLIGLLALFLFVAAYFQRGWNRVMLILLGIAIIELKSLAVGVKVFSLTVILIVVFYFLFPKNRKP